MPQKEQEVKKIEKILFELGCTQERPGIFRHPDFAFDLDFSATDENKILLRLWQIFSVKGYENCKRDIRDLIGVA